MVWKRQQQHFLWQYPARTRVKDWGKGGMTLLQWMKRGRMKDLLCRILFFAGFCHKGGRGRGVRLVSLTHFSIIITLHPYHRHHPYHPNIGVFLWYAFIYFILLFFRLYRIITFVVCVSYLGLSFLLPFDEFLPNRIYWTYILFVIISGLVSRAQT